MSVTIAVTGRQSGDPRRPGSGPAGCARVPRVRRHATGPSQRERSAVRTHAPVPAAARPPAHHPNMKRAGAVGVDDARHFHDIGVQQRRDRTAVHHAERDDRVRVEVNGASNAERDPIVAAETGGRSRHRRQRCPIQSACSPRCGQTDMPCSAQSDRCPARRGCGTASRSTRRSRPLDRVRRGARCRRRVRLIVVVDVLGRQELQRLQR